MTHSRAFDQTARRAFTLIELLVVIAIIAILASLIFPAVGAIKKRATISKVQTELNGVKTAIELFKEKYNSYPPDNPCSFVTNQLYFELMGTSLKSGVYESLDGSALIPDADQDFKAFGETGGKPCVRSFLNVTRGVASDDVAPAKNFLKDLKPGQYGGIAASSPQIRLLACSVAWPEAHPYQPVPANKGLNPWRYNSSNPTNNPGSYDLWVDVLIGNKTNRISNWSKVPQIVATP